MGIGIRLFKINYAINGKYTRQHTKTVKIKKSKGYFTSSCKVANHWFSYTIIYSTFYFFFIAFILVFKALSKLYTLAGGKLPEWLEQRGEAFMEIARVPQTTHDTDVNNAISINVQKLRENYGEPNVGDGFIKEIENFINELECIANDTQKAADKDQLTEDEKNHALECLKRIKNNPDLHIGSGLTLKQVLSLVWKACKDENKKSADDNIDINTRIPQRKYQLVKHLVESQTEYGVLVLLAPSTVLSLLYTLLKSFPSCKERIRLL